MNKDNLVSEEGLDWPSNTPNPEDSCDSSGPHIGAPTIKQDSIIPSNEESQTNWRD